jgi:hypothetical protein
MGLAHDPGMDVIAEAAGRRRTGAAIALDRLRGRAGLLRLERPVDLAAAIALLAPTQDPAEAPCRRRPAHPGGARAGFHGCGSGLNQIQRHLAKTSLHDGLRLE